MSSFDIGMLVLAGAAVLTGLMKGLVRILVGLGALVAAFVLASRFHQALASQGTWTGWSDGTLRVLSYLAVFLGVLAAGGLVAWLLRRLVKAAMLGWADRLAGAAVGLVAAALAAGLLVLPVVAYLPRGDRILGESVLAPYVAAIADLASTIAPEDLSRRYRERIDGLRKRWRGEGTPSDVVGTAREGAAQNG